MSSIRPSPSFIDDLTNALVETGATIAFDAIGGGKLASQILTGMEMALNKTAKDLQPLRLDHAQAGLHLRRPRHRPTELTRNYGMAWGVGGWLLTPFLQKIGRPEQARLRERVVDELKTTFASHYTRRSRCRRRSSSRTSPPTTSARPARSS